MIVGDTSVQNEEHGHRCLVLARLLPGDGAGGEGARQEDDGDMSTTYLYFLIFPYYYIICFGCFICINMLFYIIFCTNY